MGRFHTRYLLPTHFYYDTAVDRFKFKFHFSTYNAEVRDASEREMMSVDVSNFKLNPECRIEIRESMTPSSTVDSTLPSRTKIHFKR